MPQRPNVGHALLVIAINIELKCRKFAVLDPPNLVAQNSLDARGANLGTCEFESGIERTWRTCDTQRIDAPAHIGCCFFDKSANDGFALAGVWLAAARVVESGVVRYQRHHAFQIALIHRLFIPVVNVSLRRACGIGCAGAGQ